MSKKLSKDKLSAILRKAIDQSDHALDGSLSKERQEVEDYYLGKLPKPMHKGDSKYVSRDVFDIVDSARATVLEAFMASTRMVKFQPEIGETVDDAKQATDYTRFVFFKDNDGEQIMYDALTEGLKKRYAIAKVYIDESKDYEDYDFEGLTMEELTASVTEHDDYEFSEAEVSPEGLASGTYRVNRNEKRVAVEVIQPEDIYVSAGASSLEDAQYIVHRVDKSKADLISEGYDEKLVNELTFGDDNEHWDIEKTARWEDVTAGFTTDSVSEDNETTTVYEIYMKLDREGLGTQQRYRFTYCQDKLLDEERISRYPFASFVPLPRPHTYVGENYAEGIVPIQNARTVLIRQIINHSLMTNNPRHQVVNGTVLNPSELLDNRMGGIVNVRRIDGIAPIPQAPLNSFVFNLIGMLDEDKEEVSGVSKLSQGMNKDAISTQNAQGMVEQLISASQQRTKTISRRFGKFLKDLYLLIYSTALDHIDEAQFQSITGETAQVNPSLWRERKAASVELTLGYGEAQQESQKWAELDQYFMQDPMLSAAYGYERRYEVIKRGLEKRGIEDIETLLTPPDQMKPPEPSPAEQIQMEQMKSQIEYQRAQAQALIMKTKTDYMKAIAALKKVDLDHVIEQMETELDANRLELERFVAVSEMELAQQADTQTANYNPDV